MGPYALSLMNSSILENAWYQLLINALECVVGLLVEQELGVKKSKVWKANYCDYSHPILGTFAVVSLVFGILFYTMNLTLLWLLYLAGLRWPRLRAGSICCA